MIPTWCPGCYDFHFKFAFDEVMKELKADYVAVADIGCFAKIFDGLNISGINSLHGRVIPTALGIKMGNPKLKVIGFAGDGGTYNEGISHLIHACRYNSDFTLFVADNQIFALTVGQSTSTTEKGFVVKTNPEGVKEEPLNVLAMVLEAGATFVARMNIFDMESSKEIIKQALEHKGFSFVEFLEPCIKFNDYSARLKENAYKINPMDFDKALKKAHEWNHSKGKVPYGVFYKTEKPTFEDKHLS